MIKKCKQCGKLIFIRYKFYNDNYYCSKCVTSVKQKEIEEQKKNQEQEKKKREQEKKIKAEKIKIKNKIADKQLLEDLKKQKKKDEEKKQRIEKKLAMKKQKNKEKIDIKEEITKRQTYNITYDKYTINKYEKLLYIEADIKRLLVIEWVHGKKRIVLNSEREIRRSRAGGFSAEKFQKFIDSKKKNTIDWFMELLNKQGVLRSKYDLIKVVSKRVDLKEELEKYLKTYQR